MVLAYSSLWQHAWQTLRGASEMTFASLWLFWEKKRKSCKQRSNNIPIAAYDTQHESVTGTFSFLQNSIKADYSISVPKTIGRSVLVTKLFSLWSSRFQLQMTVGMSSLPTTFHSPFCCQPPQPHFSAATDGYSLLQQLTSSQLSAHALRGHSPEFPPMCSLCSKPSFTPPWLMQVTE